MEVEIEVDVATEPDIACLECVYFLSASESNRVKIGWTACLPDRIRSLSTASPYPLKLLAIIPGEKAVEGDMHRALYEYRRHGEWFDMPPVVQRWCRHSVRAQHWEVWCKMRDYLISIGLMEERD